MNLMRVEVEHFACIRRATVELGPGLNVLFGPNDLGKSTLARAIRAALLLPHTSSTAQEFIEWDSDENPSVRLTLELPDRRIWRVEKRFGSSGGSSILRESTDGQTFSPYKKAREVDDEIRTMLGWGIASPATKGAPRGLPTSFLAQVLLGEQADVAAVLRQTLEQDTDESGRERLTSALAAFAQDPLFKSILEEAQGKVNMAFTAKGKRKRGRMSPFREVTDEVKRVKEEFERLAKRVEDSENARRELKACNEELLRWQEAKEKAVEQRNLLRRAWEQLKARHNVEGELSCASQGLADQEAELETLRQKEALLEQTREKVDESKEVQQTLAGAKDKLSAKERVAEETLRRAKSDEAEEARLLRQGELEKRNLELDADLTALETERDSVTRARSLHGGLEKAYTRADELAEARERSERAVNVAAKEERDTEHDLELLDVAASIEQRRRAAASIEELDRVRAEVEADRAQAAKHRRRAGALLDSFPPDLPDSTRIAAMRQLAHELEVAEAMLGGGLAVIVERLEPIEVRVTADGSELGVPVNGPVSFESTRGFVLQIGEKAKISVTAGEKEAREREASLRRRWEEEVVPVLKHLGAPDLASLVIRVDEAEEVRKKAQEAETASASLEQRAGTREEQLAKLPSLRQDLVAIDRELEGRPVSAAAEMLDALGGTSLDGHRTQLKRRLAAAQERSESARMRLSDANTETKVLAERISTAEKGLAELGVTKPSNEWDDLEARLADQAERLRGEKNTLSDELKTLAAQQDIEVQNAEAKLAEVREELVTASAKLEELTRNLQALREKASRLEGEIENRRAAVAKLDVDAARRRVDEIVARLEVLPVPTEAVTEEALHHAELEVEEAGRAYERAYDASLKAEGALQIVGGQVVFEEQTATRDALRQAERKEHEVELEYDAWQLLVDKLRKAENTEGQHLGDALSQPISQRFAELTANRYGKLEVAPNLKADGLRVAGVLRDMSALSVGTQEQLATLLRLTVAEHLHSTLLLDDHLTQTDPARSAWFRDVLREHASKTQVIILTCRPLDYLQEEELPAESEASTNRAGGFVRAVDLRQVLEWGSVSASEGAT